MRIFIFNYLSLSNAQQLVRRSYKDVLTLNQIGFKKLYSNDFIDAAISDFRLKLKNINNKTSRFAIIWKILLCDKKSSEKRIYLATVKKIRELLDVNSIIKLSMEFEFIKEILFSKPILKVFKSFSDLKNLKDDKVNDIHLYLRDVCDQYNNPDTEFQNNILQDDKKIKDLDHYAAQYFIENVMMK